MEILCQFSRHSKTKKLGTAYHRSEIQVRYTILPLLGFVLVLSYFLNNSAYGAFDSDGKYYCNPGNIELEKIIYKAAVNKLNDAVDSYLSLEPNPTAQQLQSFITHSRSGTLEPTFQIMNEAQSCLTSNGIDSQSVATPVGLISQKAYAPEFGTLARLVVLVSIISVVIITRRLFMKN